MKPHTFGVLAVLLFGCSAPAGDGDSGEHVDQQLEADLPADPGDPAAARQGRVEQAIPATAQKPTPDPWRIAPPVSKPTPDPWSGEGCKPPQETGGDECGASQESAAPPAQPATLEP